MAREPDGPDLGLLDRNGSRAQHGELIELGCGLLRSFIDYATRILGHVFRESTRDDLASTCGLFHQIIEMTDGAERLLDCAATRAAHPLIRAAWEGSLQLECILQDPAQASDRSFAAWIGSMVDRRRKLRSIQRGGADLSPERRAYVAEELAELDQQLGQPEVREIVDGIGRHHWYNLYCGGRSIEALATHLGRQAEYDRMWRAYSATSHVNDPRQIVLATEDDRVRLFHMRSGREMREMMSSALATLTRCMIMMVESYLPEHREGLDEWYATVHEDFARLLGMDRAEFDALIRAMRRGG